MTPLQKSQAGVVLAFCAMVVSNVLSTATKVFNGTDNAQIARENPTYLSPDGATFSIWGFIYLFEALLVVYQLLPACANVPALAGHTRAWLSAAFLVNAAWLPIFSFHRWWLSFAVIVAYLGALLKTYQSMHIDYGSHQHKVHTKIVAFTGISLNTAWVVVATLLNFTIVSRNSGIIVTEIATGVNNATSGKVAGDTMVAVVGGNVDWAVLCVVLAASVALYRAARFADVPYAFVTAWALGGIYRMQTYAQNADFPTDGKSEDLARWAITFSLIVGVAGLGAVAKAIYKGCQVPEGNIGKAAAGQPAVAGSADDNTLTRRLSGSEGAPSNLV